MGHNNYEMEKLLKDNLRLDSASTPGEIERRSFEIIDQEIPEPRKYGGDLWTVARRCIHALGDPGILKDLELDERGFVQGMAALRNFCTIYTDTRMLAAGLVARRMDRLGVKIVPLMELPGIDRKAEALGTTRSKAAIKEISSNLKGNIVAIGNAPTALLGLLEEMERFENPALGPALIVGMPVGFVNAEQSKEMLYRSGWPKFTIRGRRGGSPLAAAAINALAEIILQNK